MTPTDWTTLQRLHAVVIDDIGGSYRVDALASSPGRPSVIVTLEVLSISDLARLDRMLAREGLIRVGEDISADDPAHPLGFICQVEVAW